MGKRIAVLTVSLLMMCCHQDLFADGATVEILLVSGKKVDAELPAVREHSLLLSPLVGAMEEQLQAQEALLEVPTAAIQSVTLLREGGSNVAMGAVVGLGVGAAVGVAYIASSSSSENEVQQGFAVALSPLVIASYGVIGTGLGALIGLAIKDDKMMKASPADPDFESLNEYARFEEGEPESLKSMATRIIAE